MRALREVRGRGKEATGGGEGGRLLRGRGLLARVSNRDLTRSDALCGTGLH